MAKRKTSSDGTLSGHWCPPSALLAAGVGQPVACVASTFEFDAAFFETELLPRFLGLRFDQTENESTFLIEREEQLALTSAAVLVDAHKVDPGQTTLRWDQIPVAVPGPRSVLHSKIVLLVWERLARLIVGSANVTRSGYRRNREVFAALDFWDSTDSVPRAPLRGALAHLELLLIWGRVPDATRQRTQATLDAVRGRIDGWSQTPDDFRPRELPRVKFVPTFPAIGKKPSQSALDQALAAWGANRRATDITVFTPFAGEPSGEGDKVVERLASVPRERDCAAWLVVPRSPADENDPLVRVSLPKPFGDAWRRSFGVRGEVRVLALPRHVKRVDRANREFHSKLLSLEDADRHLLMVGSSNFTPHGMGVGVFNAEANLLFEDAQDGMWDGIELPLSWDDSLPLDAVQWEDVSDPAEDTAGGVVVPRFFAWASYSPATGMLRVALDRNHPEPRSWTIRLGTVDRDQGELLRGPIDPGEEVLTHNFPTDRRPANPTALAVGWADDAGAEVQARMIISVEHVEDLIPPELIRALGIDAVLDCLSRGLTLAEWHARESAVTASGTIRAVAFDSLRSVDTSQYVLYRTRRFGRALHGLCERLARTPLTPPAVNYRLFKDPLGPIQIAEALTAAGGAADGATTGGADDHLLFLTAELLLSVAHATREMVQLADPKTRKWLRKLVGKATGELETRITSCRLTLGPGLAANMNSYVAHVLERVVTLHGPRVAVGVPDAS